jgi:chromosome segregation ATPase
MAEAMDSMKSTFEENTRLQTEMLEATEAKLKKAEAALEQSRIEVGEGERELVCEKLSEAENMCTSNAQDLSKAEERLETEKQRSDDLERQLHLKCNELDNIRSESDAVDSTNRDYLETTLKAKEVELEQSQVELFEVKEGQKVLERELTEAREAAAKGQIQLEKLILDLEAVEAIYRAKDERLEIKAETVEKLQAALREYDNKQEQFSERDRNSAKLLEEARTHISSLESELQEENQEFTKALSIMDARKTKESENERDMSALKCKLLSCEGDLQQMREAVKDQEGASVSLKQRIQKELSESESRNTDLLDEMNQVTVCQIRQYYFFSGLQHVIFFRR